MFLSAIGLSTNKTIGTVLSKSGGSQANHVSDKRGKAEPAKKQTNNPAKV